jgi:hypothetical protein
MLLQAHLETGAAQGFYQLSSLGREDNLKASLRKSCLLQNDSPLTLAKTVAG